MPEYVAYFNNSNNVHVDISTNLKCSHFLHWYAMFEQAKTLTIYICLERTDMSGLWTYLFLPCFVHIFYFSYLITFCFCHNEDIKGWSTGKWTTWYAFFLFPPPICAAILDHSAIDATVEVKSDVIIFRPPSYEIKCKSLFELGKKVDVFSGWISFYYK